MKDEVVIQGDPRALLAELRWGVDTMVVNHFGEHVWLGPCVVNGERIGITECCFVTDPCDRHRRMGS